MEQILFQEILIDIGTKPATPWLIWQAMVNAIFICKALQCRTLMVHWYPVPVANKPNPIFVACFQGRREGEEVGGSGPPGNLELQ